MPWLRGGDNAATYPKLMMIASLQECDDRLLNEVRGWLQRCAEMSAGHTTDYLVDWGTVEMLGGSRTLALVAAAERVGLAWPIAKDGFRFLQLIDDPEFLHMRLKAEVEADNQRKRDNSNPTLTARVRLRDGDQCRWCGVVTWWGTYDRKSGRVGTYDHLNPGKPGTVETVVVACRSCNSSRQDDRPGWHGVLLDPPQDPHYSAATAAFLHKNLGATVRVAADQRPDHQPGSAVRSVRSTSTSDPAPRPADAVTATGTEQESATASAAGGSADTSPPESGLPGSGRDGPGRAGQERTGKARRRRGRRGGTRNTQPNEPPTKGDPRV